PELAVLILYILVCPTPCALFPYTTLFRSALGGEDGEVAHEVLDTERLAHHRLPPDVVGAERGAGLQHHRQRHLGADGRRLGRQRDRKSTRLNSSHGSISYAVFCLKKKNR